MLLSGTCKETTGSVFCVSAVTNTTAHAHTTHKGDVGGLVNEHEMALRKSATANILATQTHAFAFKQQRAKGQCLGRSPVHTLLFNLLQPGVHMRALPMPMMTRQIV
jgi:hypothetical protein